MKSRIALLCLLLIAGKIYSNPLLGRWKMDLVGAENSYIIEFIDDTIYSLIEVNVNETQYQNYSIDEKTQLLDLGTINDLELTVRYSLNKTQDAFDLFFSDDMINEQFLNTFDMGLNSENSSNEISDFTKGFVESLKKGVFNLLKTLPIAAGKKIQKSH